jgi:hypothetical protein
VTNPSGGNGGSGASGGGVAGMSAVGGSGGLGGAPMTTGSETIGVGGSGGAGAGGSAAGGAGGAGGGAGGMTGAQPPGPGPANPGDGPGAVFAISKIYLGDTDRDGTHNPNGWKQYGYNVDGQITNCVGNACNQVHNHCKPAGNGSKAAVYPDGKNGIDNSFGSNILPILTAIASNEPHIENAAILSGKWTVLFDVQALGSGDEYQPLTSILYMGADLGHAPLFDGSDVWPVRPDTLTDPTDITTSTELFPASYVINNTWVSGPGGHIQVPLFVDGVNQLILDIGVALASFEMSGGHSAVTNGTISGVLDTKQFVDAFAVLAADFDPSLCSGTTIESIKTQLREASDIMKDGSPGTASETCDGISIGLGFDALPVTLGAIGPATPPNQPCN